LAIRFFILQSHYRSPLDFSLAAIRASTTGLEKLRQTRKRLNENTPGAALFDTAPFVQRFSEAMDDDFNTPIAIAVLFDFSKAINTALDRSEGISEESLKASIDFMESAGTEVLGIIGPGETVPHGDMLQTQTRLSRVMEILIELRADARRQKNFALSDTIRDRLLEAGIEIKDTKEGASWSNKTGA
ncbi:MAG: cysteine--tRNA ligase, partial [Chlorobiaceae bacterium]|nr:cysteine--tRNA ligase [Chlorobiaceae bacterium]